MRRYALASGSFVLGAVSMFLLLGVHTSTVVQRSFAQTAAPPAPPSASADEDAAIEALTKQFGVAGILVPSAMPKTPAVWMHMAGGGINGGVQQLDGMDCNGCKVAVSVLTYAGGQFKCENCSITTQYVFLHGPALNTFKFLQLTHVIPAPGPKAEPTNPNAPPLYKIKMTGAQGRMNWVSLTK
jgi:hypothetical protein